VGIDLGCKAFLVTSDGEQVAPPKRYRTAHAHLRRAARRVARRTKGGKRRRKAVRLLARAHQHVANQRRDFHHQTARKLVAAHGLIAVEALQTANLVRRPAPILGVNADTGAEVYVPNGATAKAGLNQSIQDAGWGQFLEILAHKAEEAGVAVVAVNPAGTSQTCSGCGVIVPKPLSERWHTCAQCGCSLQRDVNAARNILARAGLALQAQPA
jgi:putative transposase